VSNWRPWVLGAVLLGATVVVFLQPRIPQNQAYHNFADQRVLFGIPNCLEVISNVPFLIVGVWGMFVVSGRGKAAKSHFIDPPQERWPYLIFFAGVALTAFGSSYYHLHPANDRLVWDRLPMTTGFMALVAAVTGERVSVRVGVHLLAPLLLSGIGSVFYWSITESAGRGDLRPYALVQFGSLLTTLLLIALYPPRYTRGSDFIISLGIYGLAKAFEATDRSIFAFGGIVSGHTLKHLAAALSAFWVLRMVQLRRPISPIEPAAS
jgi:hypothetical protein